MRVIHSHFRPLRRTPHDLLNTSGEDVNTMAEKATQQPALQTAADFEAATDQCLAQIARLREQMDRDQAKIDRLKAETRTILVQLKAA